jgi:hypothetical protein
MSDTRDLELIKSLQSQITFLQQTVNSLSERVRRLESGRLLSPSVPLFPFPLNLSNKLDLKKDHGNNSF